ncbi:hypothetical protein QBC46DRAFT_165860 [Diplogelasinospora grovesii]|uniref:Subtilisin-like serine protease n=1 Tax=Diplogelasinospora grovesii TaxID=303347 RepID=A0AAN6S8L3_9PEZI|nr:hypothetical protein QBC46DRAFT_165860 [Diplogelasinospora grovesii]
MSSVVDASPTRQGPALPESAAEAMPSRTVPFTTDLLQAPPPSCCCRQSSSSSSSEENVTDQTSPVDSFPALYRGDHRTVCVPGDWPVDFLEKELSLEKLEKVRKHLWFAGSKHPAAPLHFQISIGRDIVLTERMHLHLLWSNDGTLFIKPMPQFLLDSSVWRDYLTCPSDCSNCAHTATTTRQECSRKRLRKGALGFLFTYACLISCESDFAIALEKHLFPRRTDGSDPRWQNWKRFVREIIDAYKKEDVHERFHRGELRLSRLNTIHRFTRWPLFDPYFRTWRHYGDLFRENLTWLATATVFIALVLTAMQVGLATDPLQTNHAFINASYGFSIFAIVGPIGVFGLVVVAAVYNLLKDLPFLLGLALKSPRQEILSSEEGERTV